MRLIYATDIHGNRRSFEALFRQAAALPVDAVVLGGDLLPAPRSLQTYSFDQHAFITKVMRPLIKDFQRRNKMTVLLMLGNDDSSVCAHDLLEMENDGLLKYIHRRPQPLGDYVIYGYSFVPLTPFGIKDWEKFDTRDQIPPPTGHPPFVTRDKGVTLVDIERDIRPRGTIEDDFSAMASETDPAKTIYVTHTPPYRTALDIIYNGSQVGSKSLRAFIEKHQPPFTLHGHIHESPLRSGKIFDHIGDTISVNPGDSLDDLKAVCLDTTNITGGIRRL